MAYGGNLSDFERHAASYVDQILRGRRGSIRGRARVTGKEFEVPAFACGH
jgi:hypothetical protein